MTQDALQTFTHRAASAWGPLTSELAAECARQLQALMAAPRAEAWLTQLHRDRPDRAELHRDADHGFVLLAHSETQGLYRPPHDHGHGWVIYGVQDGEVEMGTYGRVEDPDGSVRLVKRNATLVRAGEVQVYLPGDIHDTCCMSGSALLLRFSDRDLRAEDRDHHRVTRYVERDGVWTL